MKHFSKNKLQILQFAYLVFQLGLIWYIIRRFDIESNFGVKELFPVIIIGFTINFFLKESLRPAFLSLLTFSSLFLLFEPVVAIKIAVLALVLFGVMILPIKRALKLSILLLITIALILIRIHLIELADIETVVPVVASIFMFRSILFLYELKFMDTKISIWTQLSYFFMLPNLIFPLYPLVDYKTYINTFYNQDDFKIYKKGIRLLVIGVLHLMLYRIIYSHLLPDPVSMTSYSEAIQYLVFSYMMILRMSGMFHFILGILALFGMNLPPIFNLYFLTNSFNDLWRRINVYWKDFMMKVFYYPIYFKVKKYGMRTAIFLTTMIIFIITWFFHAWQWFWIRGKFSLSVTDILFWLIFGLLIALNSLYQQARKKKIDNPGFDLKKAALLSLRTIGMFTFMTFFWTFWTSTTISEWIGIVARLFAVTTKEILISLLVILILLSAGIIYQFIDAGKERFRRIEDFLRFRNYFSINAMIVLFVLLAYPPFQDYVKKQTQFNLREYLELKLNLHDERMVEKGYYETLLNKESTLSPLWEIQKNEDARKNKRRISPEDEERKMTMSTKDIRKKILYPNNKVKFKDKWVVTNRWGMRDKDYELKTLEGHYRLAILGGSYEFGSGVSNDDIYEKIAEDSLNKLQISKGYEAYEILNFSVNAYTLIQYIKTLEDQIIPFHPDVLMIASHPDELHRINERGLSSIISKNYNLEYPYLIELKDRAGITSDLTRSEIVLKLDPYYKEVFTFCLEFMAEKCIENDIIPAIIMLGSTSKKYSTEEYEFISSVAKKAGYVILDLDDPYGNLPKNKIRVGLTDAHPNKLGHQLIGEKLVEQLILHNKELKLKLNLNP
jgi:alginate O-acetyltransferase complex protein AlgI